ncbi:MAG: 6-phosphogluconolactonase [Sedimentisphaerales bacterium]|nr:6-phosphogluconolactonase [Sedimentisphaerales bacterium]
MNKLPEKAAKKPNIEVLADADAVGGRCLEIFIASAEKALKTQTRFNFAIPGGRSPEKFFKLLAKDPAAKALAWSKIHIFWADERYVPHDSPLSNYRLAADTFLCKIPIPEKNIHPVPTDLADIKKAARQYEKTIRCVFHLKASQLPRFDLIILGLGGDGHIASLLPYSDALLNTSKIACPVYINDQKPPDPPVNRITLTRPALCSASRLIIIVTGKEKAQILKDVVNFPSEELRYPVHYLWQALKKISWLVDTKAGKLL